jgi:dTDP-4-amino-4,6-dideoxygalactose transaminase
MSSGLAVDGGPALRTTPLPGWPQIPAEGRAAVDAVLASGRINYWTGQECRAFEKEYGEYVHTSLALAVANGTLALELALRSFGIGAGDEVIVPSRTFIATAGAVVATGARPVIADIDPRTNCLTALSAAQVTSPRTRALIAVHLGGYPAPLDELRSFTDQLNIRIIEDCAQAHGARYRGREIGSLGDAACFSFCQEKIVPLGEGGLIVWAESSPGAREAYERAWAYRDHGRNWQRAHTADVAAASPRFRYLNDSFGTNARLGEMEGALGRVLLRQLPKYHALRRRNAHILTTELASCPGLRMLDITEEESAQGTRHACYRLYGRIDTKALAPGWTRDKVIDAINAEGGGHVAQYGASACIGREAAFLLSGAGALEADSGADFAPARELPGAETADAESIAFYVHPTLSEADMRLVAAATTKVMKVAVGG